MYTCVHEIENNFVNRQKYGYFLTDAMTNFNIDLYLTLLILEQCVHFL